MKPASKKIFSSGRPLRKSYGQAIRYIPAKKNYGQKKPCFSKSGDAAAILDAKEATLSQKPSMQRLTPFRDQNNHSFAQCFDLEEIKPILNVKSGLDDL